MCFAQDPMRSHLCVLTVLQQHDFIKKVSEQQLDLFAKCNHPFQVNGNNMHNPELAAISAKTRSKPLTDSQLMTLYKLVSKKRTVWPLDKYYA